MTESVQIFAHEHTLRARQVEHLVNTRAFNLIHTSDNDEEIRKLIAKADIEKLRALVAGTKKEVRSLEALTIRELRDIARDLGITYYTHKTAPVLVTEILEKKLGAQND